MSSLTYSKISRKMFLENILFQLLFCQKKNRRFQQLVAHKKVPILTWTMLLFLIFLVSTIKIKYKKCLKNGQFLKVRLLDMNTYQKLYFFSMLLILWYALKVWIKSGSFLSGKLKKKNASYVFVMLYLNHRKKKQQCLLRVFIECVVFASSIQ